MAAHLAGRSDVPVEPALERVGDFAAFLDQDFDEAAAYGPLRKAELIGRPVGAAAWITAMEAQTGMTLAPGKRKPKAKIAGSIGRLSTVTENYALSISQLPTQSLLHQ